jgi:hypothetical protein
MFLAMASMKIIPGLAFTMDTDVGYIVGVVTHDVPRIGSLVWIATPTFAREPTLDEARQISSWRWPTFFPVSAAMRKRIVKPLGSIPIPSEIAPFPKMRGGGGSMGWVAFTGVGDGQRLHGPTTDRSLPIYQILNDTSLSEMIATGWMPEDEF